jgi:hypothetical protein
MEWQPPSPFRISRRTIPNEGEARLTDLRTKSRRFSSWRAAPAVFGAGLMAAFLGCSPAWAWQTAHGPTDNTGFVDVVTKPAQAATKTVGGIGTIAFGAGPVVAPDGTVYLGNEQGKLMSFKPDGTPGWSRDITPGQHIVASPVIGSDGSVYVIGVSVSRDHRGGKTVLRTDAALHVFNSTGGYFGSVPFPEHDGAGGTTASPNLWRFNGTELIIVPAVYGSDVGCSPSRPGKGQRWYWINTRSRSCRKSSAGLCTRGTSRRPTGKRRGAKRVHDRSSQSGYSTTRLAERPSSCSPTPTISSLGSHCPAAHSSKPSGFRMTTASCARRPPSLPTIMRSSARRM